MYFSNVQEVEQLNHFRCAPLKYKKECWNDTWAD